MSATDSRKRVLAPAALGLALAVLCHPDVASAAVAFLGETPRRALPLDHLGALARNHLALAGLGLALVGIGGAGLGILATRPGATRLRPAIDTLAAFAQAGVQRHLPQQRHPVPLQHLRDRGLRQQQVVRDPMRAPTSGHPQPDDPPLHTLRRPRWRARRP